MARKLRVEYPGAIYHVMNRGDRREPIFQDDSDRRRFLETLTEACTKTEWQVHAYCLMGNHFHLVIETPQGNLVAGMKWLLGTYTSRFNRRHKLFGHLFSGRYQSLMVAGSGQGYRHTVCDYVHLNPVRANLLRPEEPLRSYRWSSVTEYLKSPDQRSGRLRVDRRFGEMGIPRDSEAGRAQFERQMEWRRHGEDPAQWKTRRRGWGLGGEQFRAELPEQMSGKLGLHHGGNERQETAEAKAKRTLAEEFTRRGWGVEALTERRQRDAEKIQRARRRRTETPMSWGWIAARLEMGTAGYAANCLRQS